MTSCSPAEPTKLSGSCSGWQAAAQHGARGSDHLWPQSLRQACSGCVLELGMGGMCLQAAHGCCASWQQQARLSCEQRLVHQAADWGWPACLQPGERHVACVEHKQLIACQRSMPHGCNGIASSPWRLSCSASRRSASAVSAATKLSITQYLRHQPNRACSLQDTARCACRVQLRRPQDQLTSSQQHAERH